MTRENVAKSADPRATAATTPTRSSGSMRTWMPSRTASRRMMTACARPRTAAAAPFPTTSAARDAGLANSLWTMPRSRSQIVFMP